MRLAILPVLVEHRQYLARNLEKMASQAAEVDKAQAERLFAAVEEIVEKMDAQTARIVVVMEKVVEVVGIPKGDSPTVEELLAEARTDPVRRKVLEAALADLEFEDTEIQFP